MIYSGKVAVVTGASSGIGRQVALDLAAAGATVVAVARREALLAEISEQLRSSTPTSGHAVCDLSKVEDYLRLLARIEAEHGRIDILVNNAGTDTPDDEELESYRAMMEINFFAPVAGMFAVLQGMRERRSGVVVNVSSDDGRAPGPGSGSYPASKAALSAATEAAYYPARRQGIRLHVLYPAWVPTAMGQGSVDRGVMAVPPKAARRTEEEVSAVLLRRMGGPRLEISAARITSMAPLARTFLPRAYHRARARF